MSARDLARFGVLYLQEGEWEGQRIIGAEWIGASVTPYSEVRSYGYGYLWWTRGDGSYFATGTGGQKLLVDPNRRLVVVNRVDTGEGFSRALWFMLGPRVINPQFFELADRIYGAILPDDQDRLEMIPSVGAFRMCVSPTSQQSFGSALSRVSARIANENHPTSSAFANP